MRCRATRVSGSRRRATRASRCLVSNNWHEGVYQLANRLSLPIVAKAVKPLPPAFLMALGKIGATRDATVVIGDQLVTDVLGAHFLGMKAYLLAPLVEQDLPHTLLLRNFERLVMGERKPEGAGVPTACQPSEPADAAASPGTRSRGDAGGSRTEVRFASAIPTISGPGETLADRGGPVRGGTGKALADLGGPAVETDEPARTGGAS